MREIGGAAKVPNGFKKDMTSGVSQRRVGSESEGNPKARELREKLECANRAMIEGVGDRVAATDAQRRSNRGCEKGFT